MKCLILTSSEYGTASHHIPILVEQYGITITQVLLNKGRVKNRLKKIRQKFSKVIKIGFLGAMNGIRIRSWYRTSHGDNPPISLKDICLKYKIPYSEIDAINTGVTVDIIQKGNPDIAISLGNGYIGEKVFLAPKYGMLNIHHELLPDFQNAQSVIWSIYSGRNYTGYTIHKINAQIDQGPIIKKEELPIIFKKTLQETVIQTNKELLLKSANGLGEVLSNYLLFEKEQQLQGKGNKFTTPSIFQFIKMQKQFTRLKKLNLKNENDLS